MTSNLTFGGGMSTDITDAFRQPSTYINAENFTFTPRGSDNVGSLENVKGNTLDTNIDFGLYQELVGYVRLQEDIVYFTTSDITGDSMIHYLDVDGNFETVYTDDYTARLGFTTDPENRVVGISRIESDDIRKVYFIDGINQLRVIDLSRDYIGVDATAFDIIPDVDLDTTIGTSASAGGSYTAGVVQHAYQLYSKNGPDSTISKLSFPLRLGIRTGTSTASGGDVDESVNKAVKINISGFSEEAIARYDRIKIFSIFYTDSTEVPVISTVGNYTLSSSAFSCIDLGDTLGDVDQSEFVSYKQTSYVPTAIEEKDNYLFLGNIKEDSFHSDVIEEWDSRAYRFDSAGYQANLYDVATDKSIYVAGSNHTVVDELKVSGGTYDSSLIGEDVPTTFDCRNKYNNIFNGNASYPYKYAKGGSSDGIGGSGINVEYFFAGSSTKIDTQPLSPYKILSPMNDVGLQGNIIECQSGEVYRVGIKFINKKGQSSFVKWIGDILWEETFDSDKAVYTSDYVYSIQKVLYVKILNFPEDDNIAGWQIVRAKRDVADRSVVMNGLLVPVVQWSSETFYRPYGSSTIDPSLTYAPFVSTADYVAGVTSDDTTVPVASTIFKFISPDAMFNSPNWNDIDNYKVRAYNKASGGIDIFRRTPDASGPYFTWASYKLRELKSLGTISTKTLKSIQDFKYVTPAIPKTDVAESYDTITLYNGNNVQYLNQIINGGYDNDNLGSSSSGLILTLESGLDIDASEGASEEYFYVSIIKDVDLSRYGGCTYQSIANTTYIPFSDINNDYSYTSVNYATYGDIWTSMFYYMDMMYWDDTAGTESGEVLVSFPVESVIDTRYRLDRILDYYSPPGTFTDRSETMFIQEKVEDGIEYDTQQDYLTYDEEIGDLYRYNPVYSNRGGIVKSYAKPIDTDLNSVNSTKVAHSEKKLNGEAVDSWSNFPVADFIEVSPKYGKINTLLNTDNKLFFWQDNAFGKLAVNERSVIGDDTGQQLSLGSGSTLERFDYISNTIGNVDKYNVVAAEDAIYWTNSIKGSIYRYDNNLVELSTALGVNKYLEDKGDLVDPITTIDSYNNETLFKLNAEVLVYDWTSKKFTGIYTYDPKWFIPKYNGSISTIPVTPDFPAASDDVYNHDKDSPRATFYGITYPSTIKHVCTDKYDQTKVFDTVNWVSKSLDQTEDVEQYSDTFNEYRFYTNYQNTDWQDISAKRKERTFTSIVPRDVVNSPQSDNVNIFDEDNLDATQTFKRRIRDKFVVVDLKYDNADDNVFSVPYLNINYRKSTR